jgi:hypothetical protein
VDRTSTYASLQMNFGNYEHLESAAATCAFTSDLDTWTRAVHDGFTGAKMEIGQAKYGVGRCDIMVMRL